MKVPLRKRRLPYLAVVMTLSYMMVHHVVQRVDVYGISVHPNYAEGDVTLTDKVCLYLSRVERSGAVVFQYKHQDDEFYIERMIGLPGEAVQIVSDQVYIDGALSDDIYATEPIEKPRRAAEPVALGRDEHFPLGGNRSDSSNNRDFDTGNVSASQVIGKVEVHIWRGER